MPKKFVGENTKAVVAKARKEAARLEDVEKKKKAAEDAYWADDNKYAQRKLQRKEEKERKKIEVAERKAQNRQLHDEEMYSLTISKSAQITNKATRAQIGSLLEQQQEKAAKILMHDEQPLEENINRTIVDGVNAHTVDEAISALSLQSDMDRNPERRLKAAYEAFEETRLPQLRAEKPNLRLTQVKQLLKKEWMRSHENPLNQKIDQ